MRDARDGGGPNKPELISEHGAGQKPNKKPRTPEHKQRQVQAVVNDYAKNPRANAKKLRALGMSPKFIRAVHHSAVPNPKSEPPRGTHPGRALLRGLDTAGEYATGGLAKPSHFPGNILQSVGVGAHGLPHDKPAGFRRALTPEEFHRYQRTGHVPFDAAQMSVGMLPWGFSGSKLMGSLRRTPKGAAVSPHEHLAKPGGAQSVPAVPPGHVRVYRGEGKTGSIDPNVLGDVGAMDKGNWFTDTKAVAEVYAKRNNGRLFYVDVPKDKARAWGRRRVADDGRPWTEYRFPESYGFRDTKKPYEEPGAVQKVTEGLKAGGAQAAHRKQRALHHEERVKRVQAAEEALARGSGEEAFHAAMKELKGPLPKTQFHGLKHLTDDEMSVLREHVKNHPDLQFFDKATVWNAVRGARLHSQVPTPSEYKLLEKTFGPGFTAENFTPSALARGRHIAIETANIPRAVMSSFDVSAPMRQGLVGFARHPLLSGRELKPMMRALKSESFYRKWRQDLEAHPKYELADKSGLALTDVEHSLANREEPFQSNYAEHIPAVGHVVRGSGRAYNRFLVGQRFSIFDHLTDYAEQHGVELSEKAHSQLADYINSATGRGSLGQFERSAVGLNSIFFSPRLIASRLDFLRPDKYIGLDPFVRKQKLLAAFQTAAAVSTVLALASRVAGVKVGVDPRSSDFGKIRIGNTRIDVGGGFNQYLRLIAQLTSGQEVDADTGEVKTGQGWDSLGRFTRGKLAPTTSLLTDLATRTNYAGQKIDMKSEIGSRVTPLVLQDAYAVLHQTHNPAAAAGAYALAATGIGVQSYGQHNTEKPQTADDLRNAFKHNLHQYFHLGVTPQIDKALRLREQRATYLEKNVDKRPGRGSDEGEKQRYAVSRYNAQVDLMRKMRRITPAQARTAKRWASRQDRHVVSSRTAELGRKYFGGDVLSSAAKKIRDRGGKLYLSDY